MNHLKSRRPGHAEKKKLFEREFLIRLAPMWLACRWNIMGHRLRGWPFRTDLAYDLLGCHDYGTEMKLLCREVKSEIFSRR